ncbi:MAG: RNA 2',3'-cyclic phosphodiesterase [Acidimicrobiia bacterium]
MSFTPIPDGRYFLGIDPSDSTRHALAARLEPWVDAVPGRRVRPPNWHLTLRFIGHVEGVAVERILGSLSRSDLPARFRMRLGRLGAFPRAGRATVLWVGVEADGEALGKLAAAAEEAVRAAGLPPEDRPFHAHVTLSRIRPARGVGSLLEMVPPTGVAWDVEAVTLFRSNLDRDGAWYQAVEQVMLR